MPGVAAMKALARFEELLQQVVEAPFRRVFGGRLEPVDLARRLGRVMDDNKRVTWERPLVPNQYAIALAPKDYEDVQGFVDALQRELERFVTERAAERGYSLLAPPRVTITPESALSAGVFTVRAAMIDPTRIPPAPGDGPRDGPRGDTGEPPGGRGAAPATEAEDGAKPAPAPAPDSSGAPAAPQSPPDAARTRAMRPLEMPLGPPGPDVLYLVGTVNGRRVTWPLSGKRVRIGRGLDNEVVLDDASVSRHHAEITRENGATGVRDLGSTNGTWVNAGRVEVAAVEPGDRIAFGAVHLEVARRPEQ
jgi:FhaA, N-terminal domain/FHA domain